MIQKLVLILCCLLLQQTALSQIDTIKPAQEKLLSKGLSSSTANYLVYWEDEKQQVTGPIDLWKRELKVQGNTYHFNWTWYRNDSLYAQISSNGNAQTMEPANYQANYFKKGKISFQFRDQTVTVPDSLQSSEKSRSFKVSLNPPAFAFPMDLEILSLLPYKKVGQKFALPFYEPGSNQSAYYEVSLIRKERLSLPGAALLSCWVIRLTYAANSYAEFWIANKQQQVVKMREFYQGKYRYKVKIY